MLYLSCQMSIFMSFDKKMKTRKEIHSMLTYASELRLQPDCNKETLLDCINNWFVGSKLGEKWMAENQCSPFDTYLQDKTDDFEMKGSDQKIEILDVDGLMLTQIKSGDR